MTPMDNTTPHFRRATTTMPPLMVSTQKIVDALSSAMAGKGLAPGEVALDGQIHRCPTADKPGSLNGWYIAHADDPVSAAYGDWRTGESWTFCAKGERELTPEERDRLKARLEADKKRRQEETDKRHAEARAEAKRILAATMPAPDDHAYLVGKGVSPVGDIRIADDGRLVVPVLDAKGAVMSLQFIARDGGKRFLTGGKMQGGFFPILATKGEKDGLLYICEGFATGATIHAATEAAVLVAFNCGNLLAVAEMARGQYPDRAIILCADDDAKTAGNPGLTKATEAALAIKARLAVPRFIDHGGKSDFNDLAAAEGLDVVKACLAAAEAPEAEAATAGIENCAPVHFDEAVPPPIEPEIVPGILRTYPQALAEAIQVPFELAFINAVGTIAVAAQGKLAVAVRAGYTEPVNIYALCPLPPGERKSATVEACKRPLVEWQKAKRLEMDDDIRDAESERKTLEKAIEAKRVKAAQAANAEVRRELVEEIKTMERELPEVPIAPRFLADDFTPEALAVLLEKHEERIGLLEAEGGIFDTLAGKYSNGIPNFDIILKGWCGEPCQIDRKGRDSIFLQHPLLTMVISPQPEIVQGLSSRPGFRGRGLIGRFLYVMPQSRLGERIIEARPIPLEIGEAWRQTVHRLLGLPWAVTENGEKTAYRIGLDPAAYGLWVQFAGMVETELRPGGQFEYMTDWAGKFPGQAIRLAGLLHAATVTDPHKCAIAPDTMRSALAVAAILAEHAKAALGLMGSDPAQDCAQSILRWIMRDHVTAFTARAALEKVKGRFPTMEKINPGLAILEERAFIFEASGESRKGPGRKPSMAYIVNPKTWEA